MTDTDSLTAEALDAEDYLLDSMGDAILLWETLGHPAPPTTFARFDALRQADMWAARESVAQLVEYFQQATGALDAPADTLASAFLLHCTNAAEPATDEDVEDIYLECLVSYDLLPQAGELLAALDIAEDTEKSVIEAQLKSLRDRRDA